MTSRKVKEAILSAATCRNNSLTANDAYHFLCMVRPEIFATADSIKPVGLHPEVLRALIAALLQPSGAALSANEGRHQPRQGLRDSWGSTKSYLSAANISSSPAAADSAMSDPMPFAVHREFVFEPVEIPSAFSRAAHADETAAPDTAGGSDGGGDLQLIPGKQGTTDAAIRRGSESTSAPRWALSESVHMAVVILAEDGLPQSERHAAVEALAAHTDWSLPGKSSDHSSDIMHRKPKSLARSIILFEQLHAPYSVLSKLLEYAARKPVPFYAGVANGLRSLRAILCVAQSKGDSAKVWELLRLAAQLPASAFLRTKDDELRFLLVLAMHCSERDPDVITVCLCRLPLLL
jgi:hypothetical protein